LLVCYILYTCDARKLKYKKTPLPAQGQFRNYHTICNIGRTDIQNTLTSSGQILAVQNIQNQQNMINKTHLQIRFTIGTVVRRVSELWIKSIRY